MFKSVFFTIIPPFLSEAEKGGAKLIYQFIPLLRYGIKPYKIELYKIDN